MAQRRHILVVEDETAIAEAIRARLESEGYSAELAPDGPDGLAAARAKRPDLVILDLMLPGMDGLEVCKELQKGGWIPVVMLTARADEADRVAGLAVGADDYMTKPFSMRELTARLTAIFRRFERMRAAAEDPLIERSDLVIDPGRRQVARSGRRVHLTPIEFDILRTLAQSPGIVFERNRLMEIVWGYTDHTGGRVIDSHVARIRRKLGDEADSPSLIETIHGVGYTFREEDAAPA